ncbi:metallophosphoesterase [Lactococcus petauri]|uniref:metallophosphoesterase n=1 Tax=Lactococcus petauri TaxID=1940789 RepID=UPI001E53ECC3|nr:metallophosphoesterase [Lactococcus petauri]MDC0827077.1 metallophosphoesterase [Lactococcus petauri]
MKYPMKKFLIIFSSLILLMLVPIYSRYIEPKLLQTTYLRLGNGNPQLKFVQISDIHLSQHYTEDDLKRVIDKIINIFSGLNVNIGKYAVWGNHDYGGGAARIYRTVMESSGFQILKNNGTTIPLTSNKKIFIGGIDDGLLGTPSIKDMLDFRDEANYSIVLAHEPELAEELIGTGTQLVLSGHSHGNQVNLPINLFHHSLSKKYTRGFYDFDGRTKLYVNKGLGTTHLPLRFGSIPEISVFELYF